MFKQSCPMWDQITSQDIKGNDNEWEIHCLDDIAQGTFVCNAIGHIVTRNILIENSVEYNRIINLNHRENINQLKEHYENQALMITDDELSQVVQPPPFDQLCKSMPKSKCVKKRSINKHDSAASGSSNYALTQTTVVDEDENAFIVPSGFAAQSMVSIQSSEQLCDKDDIKTYYYMDFRKEGNMCRFIKHSCSPNLFIQYVFTDSHDTIVPKIAFFAGTFIPAGTALTADIIHKEYLYSTSIWECPLNCEY